jgi:hypothetical protein
MAVCWIKRENAGKRRFLGKKRKLVWKQGDDRDKRRM